jgi:two-component system, cell cycle response regulator
MALVGTATLANGDLITIGGVIFKYIGGGNIEALFHEEIYRMTIFDGLTRVANKRYFMEFVDREVARAVRYGSRLSLAMIDIDLFKSINDEHGHPAGDLVLEELAAALSKHVRREQLLARYGGEEFAVVMPELERGEVLAFCEKLRSVAESATFEFRGQRIPVTISAGAAMLEKNMNRDDLIQRADEQLYRAKRAGRNRVVLEGEPL